MLSRRQRYGAERRVHEAVFALLDLCSSFKIAALSPLFVVCVLRFARESHGRPHMRDGSIVEGQRRRRHRLRVAPRFLDEYHRRTTIGTLDLYLGMRATISVRRTGNTPRRVLAA